MKKRMLCILLSVCMIFIMLPTAAFAADGNMPIGASDSADSKDVSDTICTCDPQIEGEGVHTNEECPLYVAPVEKTALEAAVELFEALPSANSITDETTSEEKEAINKQLAVAMAAYYALGEEDLAAFKEDYGSLLVEAMALKDVLMGNTVMLLNDSTAYGTYENPVATAAQLAQAFNAINTDSATSSSNYVTLTNDVTLTDTIYIAATEPITLDIGTSTITNNSGVVLAVNNGTMKIKGSGNIKSGNMQAVNISSTNNENINVTIEGGTFESGSDNGVELFNTNGTISLTIEGGTFIGGSGDISAGCGLSHFNYEGSTTEITLSGGTFIGGKSTMEEEVKGGFWLNGISPAIPSDCIVKGSDTENPPTDVITENYENYRYLTIEYVPNVARVTFDGNITEHESFDMAWDAAIAYDTAPDKKATITLLENTSTATEILTNTNDYIILDTNQKTLTFSATSRQSRLYISGGSLDIDGAGEIIGYIGGHYGKAVLHNDGGEVTLTAATIQNGFSGSGNNAVLCDGGTFKMYSGTVKSFGEYALYSNVAGTQLYSGTIEGGTGSSSCRHAIVNDNYKSIAIMPSDDELIIQNFDNGISAFAYSSYVDFSKVLNYTITYGTNSTETDTTAIWSDATNTQYIKISARDAVPQHYHCICGGSVNVGDHTSHSQDIYYTAIGENFEGGNLEGDIYLDRDVTLTSSVNVVYGKTLNLCLNGHKLDAKGGNFSVILNKGTLNICDCSDAHSFGQWNADKTVYNITNEEPEGNFDILPAGVITGGNFTSGQSSYGGGITNNGTAINLYSGAVAGNNAPNGGGILNGGTFRLYNGSITGNYAVGSSGNGGAGVYSIYSSFTMYDGVIKNNIAATGSGGGVSSVVNTLNIRGGSITDNSAYSGGGIYSGQSSNLNLSGAITIIGNTANNDTANNVFLASDRVITIDAPLADTARIGITTQKSPSISSSIDITNASSTNYKTLFTSDNANYIIQDSLSSDSYVLQLAMPYISPTIGTLSLGSDTFTAGTTYNLAALANYKPDVTANSGTITAQGWQLQVNDSDWEYFTSEYGDGGVVPDTENTYKLRYYVTYTNNKNESQTIYSDNEVTMSVVGYTTALTLDATPASPQAEGKKIILTATLTGFFEDAGLNDHKITFKSGTTIIGTGALNASGVATFEWTPSVAGDYSLTAEYAKTPYNNAATSSALTYKVQVKAEAVETPSISPVTYSATGKLSDSALPAGWTWADGTIVPAVGNTGYTAYYAVSDDVNYDWSDVQGYDAQKHRVARTVELTVNAAKAEAVETPSISPVTYSAGGKLSDSTLPAGWTWADGTIVPAVGNTGYAAYYAVSDDINYDWSDVQGYDAQKHRVARTVELTVNAAKAEGVETPSISPVTYSATGKLSDSALPAGWTWADGTIVPAVGNTGYTAYYAVSDDVNYDWSDVQGYDAQNHRVARTVELTVNAAKVDAALALETLIKAPVKAVAPQTVVETTQYYGTITWSDSPTIFLGETLYTATVEVTAKEGYTLDGLTASSFSYAGATSVSFDAETGKVTIKFPKTENRELTSIDVEGTPTKKTYNIGEVFNAAGTTITLVYDDGYTNVITDGYTVTPAAMAKDTTSVTITYGGKISNSIDVSVRENLTSITTPAAKTDVANGAAKTSDALGLPETVNIVTSTGKTTTSEVNWSVSDSTYSADSLVGETFTVNGTITLPEDMSNVDDVALTTSISVTVKDAVSISTPSIDTTNHPEDTPEKITGIAANQRVVKGTTLTITADSFVRGDKTYIPVVWKTNPEGTFGTPVGNTYSATVDTTGMAVGSHTFTIAYREVLTTDATATGNIVSTSISYNIKSSSGGGSSGGGSSGGGSSGGGSSGGGSSGGGSSGGGASNVYYDIRISKEGSGTISPDGGESGIVVIQKQKDQTFTFTSEKGYTVSDVLIDGKSVGVKTSYTFDNVTSDHTLKVIFASTSTHVNPQTGVPFEDVKESDWFVDTVYEAVQNGWFKGTSDTTFGPYLNTTRGMIVTVLWRLEQSPVVNYAIDFSDVSAGLYYSDAVRWASSQKIIEGYGNSLFGANDTITREQMTAILYRYAQFKGYDVSKTSDLTEFTDASNISEYARIPMAWAVENNLISGKGNKILDPKAEATRAEAAAMLTRFDNMFQSK